MHYTDLELAEIFLATIPSIKPAKYRKLLVECDDALDAVRHAEELPYEVLGKQADVARAYLQDKTAFKNFLKLCKEKDIFCLTQSNPCYPKLLLSDDNAPLLLYAKGNVEALQGLEECITVVGTRHPTRYGETATQILCGDLAANGVALATGLSIGVEALAHEASLAQGGFNIGFVTGGIDVGIPTDNTDLAERILSSGGVILSEYPPGMPSLPWMYKGRNLLLSTISRAVLMVQAREKSGTMVTVDHAQEENRALFAVPGEITQEASYWPNRLLQHGALPALSAIDIMDELGWSGGVSTVQEKKSLDWSARNTEEKTILLALAKGALSMEALSIVTEFPMQTLMSHLTSLEMEGIIEQFPGRIVDITDAYRT